MSFTLEQRRFDNPPRPSLEDTFIGVQPEDVFNAMRITAPQNFIEHGVAFPP